MTNAIAERNANVTRVLSGLVPKKDMTTLLEGVQKVERLDKVLLVLLDGSGSMMDIMDGDTKIRLAWRVFQQELMPNMAGWAYGVILFNSKVDWIIQPQVSTTALVSTLPPRAGGTTAMGGALQLAWYWVKTHAKEARFILLSDGLPTDLAKDHIIELASNNRNIPVDCVGIGKGQNSYDPVFLRNLSKTTGGVFTEVHSVKVLANTIHQLSPTNRPLLGTV